MKFKDMHPENTPFIQEFCDKVGEDIENVPDGAWAMDWSKDGEITREDIEWALGHLEGH